MRNGNSDSPKRVALVVIATGRYIEFVNDLIESAWQFFVPDHDLCVIVLTDAMKWPNQKALYFARDHEPWPGPTLHRYGSIYGHRGLLINFDYVFTIDADMRFVAKVGNEVLPSDRGIVAVEHQYFHGQSREMFTYERYPLSSAYIPEGGGDRYYAGGFQGGEAGLFLSVANFLSERITVDEFRGVTAKWHDESHWNWHLWHCPPSIILPPSYCSDEGNPVPDAKILALRKDHDAYRT